MVNFKCVLSWVFNILIKLLNWIEVNGLLTHVKQATQPPREKTKGLIMWSY